MTPTYPFDLRVLNTTYPHSLLQPAFQRANIKTNMSLWKRVADGVPGAALWVLSQLFNAGSKSQTTANSDQYDYSLNLTPRDRASTTDNDTTTVTTASKPSTPTTPTTPSDPKDRPQQHNATGEFDGARKDWSCCHEFRHQPLDAKHLARHLIRMLLLNFATVSEATGRRYLGSVKARCMQTVVHKVLSTTVVALVHLNKRRWAHEENKKNDLMYDVRFLNGTSPINFIAHQLMRHNQNITGVQDRTPTLNLLPRTICQSQLGILLDQMSSYERAKLLHSTWKSWFDELWGVLSREYRKLVAAEASGVSLRGGNIPIYIIHQCFSHALAEVLLHPPGAQTPVRAEIAKVIEPDDIDHLHQELELLLPTLHRHSLAKSELRVLLDHMINSLHNVKKSNFFGCPNSPMPLETKVNHVWAYRKN